MAKNENFKEVTGNLVPLLAKVQAMTMLSQAGEMVCTAMGLHTLNGKASEASEYIVLGLHKMCEELRDEINALSKEIGRNGVTESPAKADAKDGLSIEGLLKELKKRE